MKLPKKKRRKRSSKKKAVLYGLGLDGQDGHVRITRGKNFHLVGGSRETHEIMQEKATKFNEELGRRGKCLEEIGPKEFVDIVHRI